MRPEDILDALGAISDDLIRETDELRKQSGAAFYEKDDPTEWGAASVRDDTEQDDEGLLVAEEDAASEQDDERLLVAEEDAITESSAGEKVAEFRPRNSRRNWTALAAVLVLSVVAVSTILLLSRARMNNQMQSAETAAVAEAEEAKEMNDAAVEEAKAEASTEAVTEEAPEEASTEGEDMKEEPAAAPASEAAEEAAPEENEQSDATTEQYAADAAASAEGAQLVVTAGDKRIVVVLNDTKAAADLLAQLPLTVTVEPYSDNEITFHPARELDTSDGLTGGGTAGMLGYFAPWNNVVLYYGDFEAYPGLYILGEVTEGEEYISELTGEVQLLAE